MARRLKLPVSCRYCSDRILGNGEEVGRAETYYFADTITYYTTGGFHLTFLPLVTLMSNLNFTQ